MLQCCIRFVFLSVILVVMLSACSEPTPEIIYRDVPSTSASSSSSASSPQLNTPTASGKYLTISIQKVTILKDVGDLNDVGEFQLGLLVVNQSGSSAKLLLPGQGTYQIRTNRPLELNSEYGISVDKAFLNNKIYVHFIGIDNDNPPPGADLTFRLFLDWGLPLLEGIVTASGGGGISLASMAISSGADYWYDWVKEQDIIAEDGVYLYEENNWSVGKHEHKTTDGNMEIVYTVMLSDSPLKIAGRELSPSSTPLPTPIPPTATPLPTPTKKPTISVPCIEPQGVFRNLWLRYKDRLGCSVRVQPLSGLFAEQPFQNGHMFWSQQAKLYVITYGQNSGTWEFYRESEDPWKNGMPDVTCDPNVIRGFGGLWCSHPEMREKLGPPLDKERGFDNMDYIQGFQNGLLLIDSDGRNKGLAYILFYNGIFTREPY